MAWGMAVWYHYGSFLSPQTRRQCPCQVAADFPPLCQSLNLLGAGRPSGGKQIVMIHFSASRPPGIVKSLSILTHDSSKERIFNEDFKSAFGIQIHQQMAEQSVIFFTHRVFEVFCAARPWTRTSGAGRLAFELYIVKINNHVCLKGEGRIFFTLGATACRKIAKRSFRPSKLFALPFP